MECVKYCVVYDNNTSSLEMGMRGNHSHEDEEGGDDGDDDGDDNTQDHGPDLVPGPAVVCGRLLTHLTRDPVHILRGGYERFTALYHFFRTQKIIWMPQELDAFQPYPIEIIPGKVFLGNLSQACNPTIHKDLKIKAHVNISMASTPL
uniref:Serine/threonine/tyrosine-interacting-like protein 1 n=1 Tax=Castor canadensis TaxID=51338 RepID=A0A8B7UVL3_CASCN|nr:serine/threonine/tyrosine-interacting-like protein 1 [Castor canadensis]